MNTAELIHLANLIVKGKQDAEAEGAEEGASDFTRAHRAGYVLAMKHVLEMLPDPYELDETLPASSVTCPVCEGVKGHHCGECGRTGEGDREYNEDPFGRDE